MPELPEVQTVVNTLRPRIVGQPILQVDLRRQDILCPQDFDLSTHLVARRVMDVTRRGKRIVITLEDANRFYIHLGMSGRLTVVPTAHEIKKHTHLILHFPDFAIHFNDPRRFGGVFWLGANSEHDSMGPEPLTLRSKELAGRLSKTKRAIKNALLDQTVIAGLGNIYVDESLFLAGVHPLTIASRLTDAQINRLNRAIKTTLRRALRHRGSTLRDYVDAEGGAGTFQKLHKVYDRAGQPCRTCREPIKRIVLGGRSTCFCPKCQPRGRSR